MNIAGYLDATARWEPRLGALVQDEEEVTYGGLLERVRTMAGLLRTLGVERGSRVAVMFPNSIDFVVVYLGVLRLGAVVVSVNYMNRRHEVAHILRKTGAGVLLTQERTFEGCRGALDEADLAQVAVVLMDAPADDERSYAARLARTKPEPADLVACRPEDHALIIFTSAQDGGLPRGAILSHGNLHFSMRVGVFEYGLNRRSVHLGVLPFFHCFGQTNTLLVSLMVGAKVVIFNRVIPGEIGEAAKRHQVTHFAVVPTILGMLVPSADLDDDAFGSLVHLVSGGAALPLPLLEGFERRFGVRIQEGYGLTEAAPTVSYTRLEWMVKPGTVGLPVPDSQVVALDADDNILPPGEIGEVAVRGPHVFQGYLDDPEHTARVMRNDWLHTGDLGFVDEDNHLTLTGLKKRMYLTGGLNIYPEEVLRLHGLLPEIETIELYAEPDLIQGDILKARVRLKPGVELNPRQLRRRAMEVMSIYKVPRAYEIIGE
jgi:long-chain acyl-CoA synthetase